MHISLLSEQHDCCHLMLYYTISLDRFRQENDLLGLGKHHSLGWNNYETYVTSVMLCTWCQFSPLVSNSVSNKCLYIRDLSTVKNTSNYRAFIYGIGAQYVWTVKKWIMLHEWLKTLSPQWELDILDHNAPGLNLSWPQLRWVLDDESLITPLRGVSAAVELCQTSCVSQNLLHGKIALCLFWGSLMRDNMRRRSGWPSLIVMLVKDHADPALALMKWVLALFNSPLLLCHLSSVMILTQWFSRVTRNLDWGVSVWTNTADWLTDVAIPGAALAKNYNLGNCNSQGRELQRKTRSLLNNNKTSNSLSLQNLSCVILFLALSSSPSLTQTPVSRFTTPPYFCVSGPPCLPGTWVRSPRGASPLDHLLHI